MAGEANILLNKWYHVAGVISATGSDSGMKIYVDGHRMQLARTRESGAPGAGNIPLSGTVSGIAVQNNGGSADVVAMPTLTSPRLLIGSDRALAGAQVAHDVGLTRVFNRALSDAEVFQNFIATCPSNVTLFNFKIG